MSNKVLALYDFASKQEYIYRTSKIKEISGASLLLAGMYRKIPGILAPHGITLQWNMEKAFSMADFDADAADGIVLYEGGGNLMVLFRSEEIFKASNRILSEHILRFCPGLTMITACVKCNGSFDEDRKNLYAENARRKNAFPAYDMPAVTPMTQIDPMTFLPVVYKRSIGKKSYYPHSEVSLSADRVSKLQAYMSAGTEEKDNRLDELEDMTAVIYIDGNSMGNKLKACADESYDEGVRKLRDFSKQVQEIYVAEPLQAIRNAIGDGGFRKVIGGGDEITIICEAKMAWKIVQTYFETTAKSKLILENLSEADRKCTSCAGIAIAHAKAPFSVVYEIAEAACESAKKKSRTKDGNYVDFYFCHAGVTADFDTLRDYEQRHATGRPYLVDDASEQFAQYAPILQAAGRANVKSLGAAAQDSPQRYLMEVQRVNAYLPKGTEKLTGTPDERTLVYDMAEFYDLWFAKKKEADGQ
ncbi:MAG: hypothetical protein IJT41_06365 [Clostridia bacterium]|nr:hypothetical protein [Clostridia bacterium]